MTDTAISVLVKVVTVVCAIVIPVVWVVIVVPDPVEWDYKHTVTVDSPDKVEAAVSNVLHLLVHRDFVPTGLEIRKKASGAYIIRGYGVDRGHMLQWD